jgi:hypothetical protein
MTIAPLTAVRFAYDSLERLSEPLARRVEPTRFVVGFVGNYGVYVVYRTEDDEAYIATTTQSNASTLVLRQVEIERDPNWGDIERATHMAQLLAAGMVIAEVEGHHRIVNESRPATKQKQASAVEVLVKPRHEIVKGSQLETRKLSYADLARWPLMPQFVYEHLFIDAYAGPGGVYVVYRQGSFGALDFRGIGIVTMRGEERTLVWLMLDRPESWTDKHNAIACAHALADGLIFVQEHDGELVVDEFDADKALDTY